MERGLATGAHNSPHLPDQGHAGIVFMFGSSSHTLARGNVCMENNGAGIALIGDLASQGAKWRAYHWVLENNQLKGNRWGIYAKHADWVAMGGNRFEDNEVQDIAAESHGKTSTWYGRMWRSKPKGRRASGHWKMLT